MRRFDAVISDIDGCLNGESTAPFDIEPLAQLAAHNRAAQSGAPLPVVTVCSGRPQPYAEAMCRLIANTSVPAVAEMGVWLFDPRDNAFHRDPAITPDHFAAVHAATLWIERELVPRGVVIQPGKSASISLWHKDSAFLFAQMPLLRQTFTAHNWPFRVSRTVAWVNCDLAHVSKSTGIARLKAATGLETPRLAGIGDTPGDMAIREHVEFFACPANATDDIKSVADYVSPFPEARGVLDILARLPAT